MTWLAPASAAPFELAWSAPEGCPARDAILDATYAKLGEARSEDPPELFVEGTVAPMRGGFVVKLALVDAVGAAIGEREVRIERPSCGDILKPASVVLAMMIAVARPRTSETDAAPRDVRRSPGPVVPTSPLVPTSPSPPRRSTQPVAPPRPEVRPRYEPAHRLSLGSVAVGSLGVVPGVGLGVGLRASYQLRSILFVGLEAAFEAGASRHAGDGEVGFQFFSAAARVGLPMVHTRSFEFLPILVGRLGLIRMSPSGFALVQNRVAATPSVGVGVLARSRITPSLFIEVLPEIERILLRHRFQVLEADKLDLIFQPGPFGGRLSIGVVYEFR